MTYTSVSPKYQVVIPKEIRNKISVKPGQKLVVYERDGIIYLVPDIPLKKMRGMFKDRGIDLKNIRDKSDRAL